MNRADEDGAAATDGMTIRVLGTLDVIADGGHRLALSSPKVRRLLAALLVDAGAVVSATASQTSSGATNRPPTPSARCTTWSRGCAPCCVRQAPGLPC